MFDLRAFVTSFSYIGVFGILFAETGLLIGLILPGDSLLFIAGFLASQHLLSLPILLMVVILAAFIGNTTGYWIGRRLGPMLFERSRLVKEEQVDRAHSFFNQHGGKAVVLSRFLPIVRTLVPLMSGFGDMDFGRFTLYNLIGALVWGVGVTVLGYFLGRTIPNIDHYLLPAVLIVIVASLLPTGWHYWRRMRKA